MFDPSQFGDCILGKRPPESVQPATMFELTLDGLGAGREGNGPMGNVAGACYVVSEGRLYVYGTWITPSVDCRIYVYQVNA